MDSRFLFVYGSLKRGGELHHHLARLGARFLGSACVDGERSRRGRFPGARPTSRSGKRLRGELFQLRWPARDLRVLDKVEGFIPGAPLRSEFGRAVAEIVLNNGEPRSAWIYWLAARRTTGRLHG
jgi:gamma-glutamylcyclotransferase (GGCT)/AIG2-like uncharacterized protein YtfP